MKKTIYSDINCLDARHLTEETASQIESISDVSLLLVSEQSAPFLSRIKVSGVSSTLLVKDDVKLLRVNGQHTFTAGSSQQNVYLMINGQLTFDQAVTADEIEHSLAGGMINGQIIGSAAQISALTRAGVQFNGQTFAYPDGARLRSGSTPITAQECLMIAENSKLHILKRVMLEKGSVEVLTSRAIKITCQKQLFVRESDAALMATVYDGDPSNCIVIPDGFKLSQQSSTVTRQNAMALQENLFIYGSIYIHEVNPAHLCRLESLHVTGKVYLPIDQMDLWIPLITGEPEWIPYEGSLQILDGVATISTFAAHKTLLNNGVATFDDTLTPEFLQDNVKLFINNGVLKALPAQIAALQDVLLNNGQITTEDADATDTPAPPQDPNFNYITDMMQYVL